MDEFHVATDGLRTDAATWLSWSDRLAEISAAVPRTGPDLALIDFSALDGAPRVAALWAHAAEAFAAGLTKGADSFAAISTNLVTIAGLYETADADVLDAFARTEE